MDPKLDDERVLWIVQTLMTLALVTATAVTAGIVALVIALWRWVLA